MTDTTLPTLLAKTDKSEFRARVHSLAWHDECGGTIGRYGAERPGLVLLSATAPDTAIRAIRALLYSPDIAAEFIFEEPDSVKRFSRAHFMGKGVTYDAKTAKLGRGVVHLTAVAKIPGVMPCLSDDHLFAELNGQRFTTPLLRSWVGWIKRRMIEDETITMAEGINSQTGILTADSAQLDEIVSEGVRSGFLKMVA